jgi:glycerophosphoryl diester phosphodiesterase
MVFAQSKSLLIRAGLVLLALACGGCAVLGGGGEAPMVFAHRAASGVWQQNSRTAVAESIEQYRHGEFQQTLAGIEVDIVLSKDSVPVLSHDPWVHDRCVRIDGKRHKRVLIRDLDFAELAADYLCGGIVDPEFPLAKVVSESILGFDEFAAYLQQSPDLAVYLDLKIDRATRPAGEYGRAIFSRWKKYGLKNPLYIEAPNPSAVSAVREHANRDYVAVLSYPEFNSHDDWTLSGAEALIKTQLEAKRPVRKARQAGVTTVVAPIQVLSKKSQKKLRRAGMEYILFTANDRKSLKKACRSGALAVLTDFPELGRCR